MTMNPLRLSGWEELSTWGVDNGIFYAQLTPNGASDAEGPHLWIAPPQFGVRGAAELSRAIAAEIGASAEEVATAMRQDTLSSGEEF